MQDPVKKKGGALGLTFRTEDWFLIKHGDATMKCIVKKRTSGQTQIIFLDGSKEFEIIRGSLLERQGINVD